MTAALEPASTEEQRARDAALYEAALAEAPPTPELRDRLRRLLDMGSEVPS